MAAALVSMAGRFSLEQLDDPMELVAECEVLRARAAPLAQADAEAYGKVLDAYRLPRNENPEGRKQAIRAALGAAADVPLLLTEIAAAVASAAARVAEEGNRNLRGDALTAALLADAGGRSAAALVAINVRDSDDPRVLRAERHAAASTAAAARALTASS